MKSVQTGVFLSLALALFASPSAFAVFASTSSEISDSTSGSTKKIFGANEQERVHQFVDQNYDRLQEQAAKGSGPLLNDFASLMGCQNSNNVMSKALQENYSQLFHGGKAELLPRTEQLIKENPVLTGACEIRS